MHTYTYKHNKRHTNSQSHLFISNEVYPHKDLNKTQMDTDRNKNYIHNNNYLSTHSIKTDIQDKKKYTEIDRRKRC